MKNIGTENVIFTSEQNAEYNELLKQASEKRRADLAKHRDQMHANRMHVLTAYINGDFKYSILPKEDKDAISRMLACDRRLPSSFNIDE